MRASIFHNQWFRFLIVTAIVLFIPYTIHVSVSRFSTEFNMRSILYTFNPFIIPYLSWSLVSIISTVNLILIVIPSAYFTYRRLSRMEGESLEILGLITIILTIVVTLILDHTAFTSMNQRDISNTPTPNFTFLPTFALFLLIFHVITPVLKEKFALPTSISDLPKLSDLRSRLSSKIPSTSSGWLLLILLTFPSLLILEFSNPVLEDTIINSDLLSSFYTLTIQLLQGGSNAFLLEFMLGGPFFIDNMILLSTWNFLFVVAIVLFSLGKLKRERMIAITLVSIIPSLLYSFISLFSFIFGISSTIAIALPLVQLGGLFILRQVEKVKESRIAREETDRSSEKVKIPLSYLLKSFFRRRNKREFEDEGDSIDIDAIELALEDKDK